MPRMGQSYIATTNLKLRALHPPLPLRQNILDQWDVTVEHKSDYLLVRFDLPSQLNKSYSSPLKA
jgi:hypothetical protein